VLNENDLRKMDTALREKLLKWYFDQDRSNDLITIRKRYKNLRCAKMVAALIFESLWRPVYYHLEMSFFARRSNVRFAMEQKRTSRR